MDGVEFVAVSDIIVSQAERVVALRRSKPGVGPKWLNAKIFADTETMLAETRPDCVLIGVPPVAHGSDEKPLEIACANAGVHMFIEKPISCVHPDQMKSVIACMASAATRSPPLVVSVAYMFRYSAAIRKMQELVREFGPVRAFQARYNCAYTHCGSFWWDIVRSGGPIVEQATHFVDLARLFCGEADLSSVRALALAAADPLGSLTDLPAQVAKEEASLPESRRVPRVTSAIWRFKSGALGTLNHTVLMHGSAYETQIELLGDGYQLVLRDPYASCELKVRRPNSEAVETLYLPDDPYRLELETFVAAVRGRDPSKPASSYTDATRTHELAWAIRRAAESSSSTSSVAAAEQPATSC